MQHYQPPYLDLNNLHQIPDAIKAIDQWITWHSGLPNIEGKFSKLPVGKDGTGTEWQRQHQWRSFDEAVAMCKSGRYAGIGFVLPARTSDGRWIVALDFDDVDLHKKNARKTEIQGIWASLGKPYVEISPSGKGVRMFVLSDTELPQVSRDNPLGGKDELFCRSPKWVTCTANVVVGSECPDATEAVGELYARLSAGFPKKQQLAVALAASLPPELVGVKRNRQLDKMTLSLMGVSYRPETPENIAYVKDQLNHISADCTHDKWRNAVWATLSTGWICAVPIAREWSKTSREEKYNAVTFDKVVSDFDPLRGITLGTLDYMAREAGWEPSHEAPVMPAGGSAAATARAQPAGRFDLLTYQDLQGQPPMQSRIKGVLPERGLAAIYGASGSGKSFLAIHMAGAIAYGLQTFFGSVVRQAPVVYVVLEGAAGIARRIEAWSLHNGLQATNSLRIVNGNFTLTHDTDAVILADEVVRVVGKGAVVIIDTLNQSAPGSDENSSVDMGLVLKNAKTLSDEIEGLVVLVHHAGKDASKGMRGHSSLWAAMDAVIEVVRDKDGRRWRNAKQKDAADGAAFGFELVPYPLGQDEDGDEIRSCAVRPLLATAAVGTNAPRKAPSGRNQVLMLLAVQRAAASGKPLPRSDAIRLGALALTCDTKHRASRAASVIDSLVKSGHLIESALRNSNRHSEPN